jgi:hypothetical protein
MIERRKATFQLMEHESPESPLSERLRFDKNRSSVGRRSVRVRLRNYSSPGLKRRLQRIAFLALLLTAVPIDLSYAVIYNASKIIAISIGSHGEVYIRWDGLPDPGPCGGENYHWVEIPATASDTLKSLALSLYFSGKSARIDTAAIQGTPPASQPAGACTGAYENVTFLYSPSGG